jgi:DNA-binding protein HU-beta
MTKSELIRSVAEKSGLTHADADRAVNALCATVAEGLSTGERVPLRGFGSFSVRRTKSRTGRHPRTGARIEIPARNRVRFRAGKDLESVI